MLSDGGEGLGDAVAAALGDGEHLFFEGGPAARSVPVFRGAVEIYLDSLAGWVAEGAGAVGRLARGSEIDDAAYTEFGAQAVGVFSREALRGGASEDFSSADHAPIAAGDSADVAEVGRQTGFRAHG